MPGFVITRYMMERRSCVTMAYHLRRRRCQRWTLYFNERQSKQRKKNASVLSKLYIHIREKELV
jgi:hypothetical protein